MPVGTSDKVKATVGATLIARGVTVDFDVVSNPEFLKEGAAIADFMKPDRVVVGTDNPRTAELLKVLYDPFTRNHQRMIIMDLRSAELTKYAANAMLATKISFMNELANIAERLGADIEMIRTGIGSDPRIGYSFIYPGAGYGGSCFPKDVKALTRSARDVGHEASILTAVESVNDRQKHVLFDKIIALLRRQGLRAARSRSGVSHSSQTPTTCAKRLRACSWRRSGPRARRCAPMTRWRWPRRGASTATRARFRALRERRGGARRRRRARDLHRVAGIQEPRFRALQDRAEAPGRVRRAEPL